MTIQEREACPSKTAIEVWLKQWIARELGLRAEEIEVSRSLLNYSLSSVTATILVGDLEDWLGLTLPPTLVWDYPSIEAMADFLVAQHRDGVGPLPSEPPHGLETSEAADVDSRRLLADLDHMSDEEVNALLGRLIDEGQPGATA